MMVDQLRRRKVLLLGLDAADAGVLRDGMDDGTLPNLARVRGEGVWGVVSAPTGFGSGAVWPSFATGMSPATHGRYYYRQVRSDSYEARDFDPEEFGATPVWERLSDAGRQVAVIDLPKVGLSTGLNGMMAVDWMVHGHVYGGLRASPPQFGEELVARFGGDPVPKCDRPGGRDVAEHRVLLRQLLDRVDQRERCTRHYYSERDWDLFVTVFGEPHCIGHQAWHVRDPRHPQYDPAANAALGDPVLDVYRAIDAAIGRIIDDVDDDTVTIVFSGTGMGPNYTGNYLLDDVLRRIEGVSATKRTSAVRSLKRFAKRVVPRHLRQRARRLKRRIEESAQSGDRARRRAYAVPHNDIAGAVRLNIVGREANGVLRPEDVDDYFEHLRGQLMALRNADTGGPVVEQVVRISDEIAGDRLDNLPDLFVVWHRDTPIDRVRSDTVGTVEYVHRGNRTGDHAPESLFLAAGPGVSAGEVPSVSIYDFAPTIAAVVGEPLDGTDGRVIDALDHWDRVTAT